jgi:hypothetical protein
LKNGFWVEFYFFELLRLSFSVVPTVQEASKFVPIVKDPFSVSIFKSFFQDL